MFILLYRPPKSKSKMISHPFADNPKFRIVDYTSITLRESNVTMENHPYYNHLQTFFSSPWNHMKTSFFTCHLWFPDGIYIFHMISLSKPFSPNNNRHFLRQDGEEFNFFGRTGQRPTGEPINGYLAGDRTVSSLGLRPDSEIAIAPKDVMDVFFPYEDDDEGPFCFLNLFILLYIFFKVFFCDFRNKNINDHNSNNHHYLDLYSDNI